MAIAGVPPLVFGVVALIDLLYQFWVHTEQVGKLGWFDRWFCSPSNHRVHHAVNDALPRPQLRRRADRLGPPVRHFKEDGRACVYGTRAPLRSWNPLWANLQVYADLARDAGGRSVGRTSCASGGNRQAGVPTTSPPAGRSRRSPSMPSSASIRPCRDRASCSRSSSSPRCSVRPRSCSGTPTR